MERERGFKVIALVALIVAVAGVSIGFAAFTKDLTINVAGTVTPEDLFSVQFSTDGTSLAAGTINAGEGTTTGVNGTAQIMEGAVLSNITASFTKPGDTAVFHFYVVNTSDYVAYLKSITLSAANATCTKRPSGDINTVSNGATACADMDLSVDVGGSTAGFGDTTSIAGTNSIAAKNGSTYSTMPVTVTLTYGGSAYVDESINVSFGSVLLGFSTSNN